jgi:ribonuclease D
MENERPPLIASGEELTALAQELAEETSVAVDLEADSYHCYFARVCLLQFTTSRRTVLLDPLAFPDLDPLKPVMADRGIRKIFHAADYDVRCLHRDFGIEVHNLFDTMTAFKLLGEECLGLGDLVRKYFGVEMDKRFQRANWAIRPLPEEMLQYAAGDTRYLHRLTAVVEKQLKDKGRMAWAEEEFVLLEDLRHNDMPGHLVKAMPEAAAFNRRQIAALEGLLHWRDDLARRHNRRYFQILSGTALTAMAAALPASAEELAALKELPASLRERHGQELLKIMEEVRLLPEDQLPELPSPPSRQRNFLSNGFTKDLKAWRTTAAAELGLDPGTLINNSLLEEIARRKPVTREALGRIPGLKRWQIEALGEQLIALIRQPGKPPGKPKRKRRRSPAAPKGE